MANQDIYEQELLKASTRQSRKIARREAELAANPPSTEEAPSRFALLRGRGASIQKGFKTLVTGKKQFGGSVQKRQKGVQRLAQAFGAIPTSGSPRSGPGRPRGTYKYGIPIQQYKKLQAQRGALYKQYGQQQQEKLLQRGFTPQQVMELQAQRTSSPQNIPDTAQDELEFQRFLSKNTITPNTQAILDNLKRIQNKAITDDINQQRVHRERLIVNEQQSLLKARNLFGPDSNKIDIFDDTRNPLKAENMFAQERQNNVFGPTGRPTLLQTAETGNRFSAFTEERNILNAPKLFSLENSQQHRLKFF